MKGRYYIVSADDLTVYGDCNGMERERAAEVLKEMDPEDIDVRDIIIIYGVEVAPTRVEIHLPDGDPTVD